MCIRDRQWAEPIEEGIGVRGRWGRPRSRPFPRGREERQGGGQPLDSAGEPSRVRRIAHLLAERGDPDLQAFQELTPPRSPRALGDQSLQVPQIRGDLAPPHDGQGRCGSSQLNVRHEGRHPGVRRLA
eukprot:12287776-Alexandrium_andersonii.AAC.1